MAGAIPTAMAGLVTDARGVLIIRFFVGILGGSFVPCQVWSTQFYDKSVVGTANGLMAGIGNAGGGITYFVMPAIFDSLVTNQHLTPHVAWRVSFVVPFILISAIALGMLLFCEDTPTGAWADRHEAVAKLAREHAAAEAAGEKAKGGKVVDLPTQLTGNGTSPTSSIEASDDKKDGRYFDPIPSEEAQVGEIEIAEAEVVVAPTLRELFHVCAFNSSIN